MNQRCFMNENNMKLKQNTLLKLLEPFWFDENLE